MIRMYSPSPTVASSRVPLYLQGVHLGQDEIDLSEFDWTAPEPIIPDFTPTMPIAPDFGPGFSTPGYNPFLTMNPTLQPLLDRGFTSSEAQLINSAAASGQINNAQFQSILAGNHSNDQIKATIFGGANTAAQLIANIKAASAAGKLPPGPSPRVATPPAGGSAASVLTQQSIPGVPNWMLFAGVGVALLAMVKR